MSETVERRLRDVVADFPRPDPAVTRRVGERLREHLNTSRPRRRAALVVIPLAAALATGVALGRWTVPASATDAATFRSIDVTMICATEGVAGFRNVSIFASPRVVTPTIDTPGQFGVTTGAGLLPPSLVIAGARGGVRLHRLRCSTTEARIPLSRRGLPGRPIDYQKKIDCPVSRRVILRLRATFASPGPWVILGQRREYRGVRRDVKSAAVAIRTWPARKALAFASLDSEQNTRLWTASVCT